MISVGSPTNKGQGCPPPPRLRGYVLIFVSVIFAFYLLFWFHECFSGRMEIVDAWSVQHNVLVRSKTVKSNGGGTACYAKTYACVPETITVGIP